MKKHVAILLARFSVVYGRAELANYLVCKYCISVEELCHKCERHDGPAARLYYVCLDGFVNMAKVCVFVDDFVIFCLVVSGSRGHIEGTAEGKAGRSVQESLQR